MQIARWRGVYYASNCYKLRSMDLTAGYTLVPCRLLSAPVTHCAFVVLCFVATVIPAGRDASTPPCATLQKLPTSPRQLLSGLSTGYTYTEDLLTQVRTKTTVYDFSYGSFGLRSSVRIGSRTLASYSYTAGDFLLETLDYGNEDSVQYTYDSMGRVTHETYENGDVIAILDEAGNPVVEYTYDAWGNVLSTTGSMASTLGLNNPLRYRGYVYDRETGLYYLQSRYYDPEMGRFINADALVSTGQGLLGNNMFAYCLNNPVNSSDPTGAASALIPVCIIAIGGAVGAGMGALSAATTGGNVSEGATEGFLTGVAGTAIGISGLPVAIAFGAAFTAGVVLDLGVQLCQEYSETQSHQQLFVNIGRTLKTGIQTGIGAIIPGFGKWATDAIDAFAACMLWGYASVYTTVTDIIITNTANPKGTYVSAGAMFAVGGNMWLCVNMYGGSLLTSRLIGPFRM